MNTKKLKPRQVYYDITIKNTQLQGTDLQPLRFSETRNTSIIQKANDYSLSIVRFTLDTYSLPTFIADIESYPNTDVNNMIEYVSFEYGITGVEEQMKWSPTNEHVRAPEPLSQTNPDQVISEYYYGNSFRHYCDLVNKTFVSLTTRLKSLVGSSLNNLLPPMLIWNNENQTASLIGQEEFYNEARANHVNIYFNRALYAKFTSLPALKNYNNHSSKVYKIYMKSDYSTKLLQLDPLNTGVLQVYIKTDQEYSTISNWTPVSNICFTSNSMPIIPTQVSEPIIYDNVNTVHTKLQEPIITDMTTGELVFKPSLIYVPSAEYRFIDMFSETDITTVDINVYWRDKGGRMYPFYLQSGGSCTIKILFQLKE